MLTESDVLKIRRKLVNPQHRLFWDIARFTGERWGAICQLQVEDVYQNAYRSKPHADITFRAVTRKATPDGFQATRQVPIHPSLKEILEAYKPELDAYLFPSRQRPARPITFSAADKMFRAALFRAGIDHKGISTHSTRRTFITHLYQKGCDLKTLQKITGHRDLKSLMEYIDVSSEQVSAAIALL